jgi:tRNA-splicing ligase RtcB
MDEVTAVSRKDPYATRAQEMCLAAGIDPNSRVPMPGSETRTMPAWCDFRDAARQEHDLKEAQELAIATERVVSQPDKYKNAPLTIYGQHEESTVQQMKNCMSYGNVVSGILCADGHLGYAQPVGGVIAYEDQISISGVGFDIGCGNMAVKLDVPYDKIKSRINPLARDIAKNISFGVGRTNTEKVEHELFDREDAWKISQMADYKQKAGAQLGTVGSGNHYVDLFYDEDGFVWIGVHFGSRGLGHTTASKYLKLAGGKDGMNVPPTVLDAKTDLGRAYIEGMKLAGEYAYAGREWVVEKVRSIIGGKVLDTVHNHHNYAWLERHSGKNLWVVRKGATPSAPGQRGFVGGSMGDNAVIIKGLDSHDNRDSLYSSIHGAGRKFGRKEAKRRFRRDEMDEWLNKRQVTVIGGDLDESPMAYRRLPSVLSAHASTIKVLHNLTPFVVVMAGSHEVDPWKD